MEDFFQSISILMSLIKKPGKGGSPPRENKIIANDVLVDDVRFWKSGDEILISLFQ
jgi:hypothetical protein